MHIKYGFIDWRVCFSKGPKCKTVLSRGASRVPGIDIKDTSLKLDQAPTTVLDTQRHCTYCTPLVAQCVGSICSISIHLPRPRHLVITDKERVTLLSSLAWRLQACRDVSRIGGQGLCRFWTLENKETPNRGQLHLTGTIILLDRNSYASACRIVHLKKPRILRSRSNSLPPYSLRSGTMNRGFP